MTNTSITNDSKDNIMTTFNFTKTWWKWEILAILSSIGEELIQITVLHAQIKKSLPQGHYTIVYVSW